MLFPGLPVQGILLPSLLPLLPPIPAAVGVLSTTARVNGSRPLLPLQTLATLPGSATVVGVLSATSTDPAGIIPLGLTVVADRIPAAAALGGVTQISGRCKVNRPLSLPLLWTQEAMLPRSLRGGGREFCP